MAPTEPENVTSLKQELRELARKNRWYIENRWSVEEQQADAKRVADQLLALASGEILEPITADEQPQPDLSDLSLIHISEPTRRACRSRMPSSA